VAWVAERKDVLCAFFWMLTLLLYVRHAAQPSIARYLFTLGSFVLCLMAKPMGVTLPFVLLLLDYWPLNRVLEFASEMCIRDSFYGGVQVIVGDSRHDHVPFGIPSQYRLHEAQTGTQADQKFNYIHLWRELV